MDISNYERFILVGIIMCLAYILICQQVDFYFKNNDPVLNEIKNQLAVLHPRFQNVEIYEGDRSYTINKKRVHICLKDDHGRYYNRNMLVYVTLHEYAHILCDEVGHTPKFFKIFDELLQKAAKAGLYNPKIPPLEKYCGVE